MAMSKLFRAFRGRLLILLFLSLSQSMLNAQEVSSFAIEADVVGESTHTELLRFSKRFDAWISSKQDNTPKITLRKECMLNNFIMFSEDGLMMKDFKFHSVESCKK